MARRKHHWRAPDDRFRAQLGEPDENGCIPWLGYVDKLGYGVFSIAGKLIKAHIFAWELENGTVPDELVLDHVHKRGCRRRDCVNVEHLEPVTIAENNRRAAEARTHCIHGHAYAERAIFFGDGVRRCRDCRNRYQRERRARRRMERTNG